MRDRRCDASYTKRRDSTARRHRRYESRQRDRDEQRSARRAAERARKAFLTDRLARPGGIPQAKLAYLGLTTLLHRANSNKTRFAARLLAVEPARRQHRYGTEEDFLTPLGEYAARSARHLAAAAGAVAAAMAEYRMGEYGSYEGMAAGYLDLLVAAGYPLSDHERGELDRAAVRRAERERLADAVGMPDPADDPGTSGGDDATSVADDFDAVDPLDADED